MTRKMTSLKDQVRRSSNAMRVIASMLPRRYLLIPGFRDVLGVFSELCERVKTVEFLQYGEYDYLLLHAAKRGLTSIVKILLDAGIDTDVWVTAMDGDLWSPRNPGDRTVSEVRRGRTPLYVATRGGHTEIVMMLLDAGADMEIKDRWSGRTPLHHAAWFGRSDIVSLLLDAGAEKEVKDKLGKTPLHWAVRSGHTDTVRLLLDAGADKNVMTKRGKTPLLFAIKEGHNDIVALLS